MQREENMEFSIFRSKEEKERRAAEYRKKMLPFGDAQQALQLIQQARGLVAQGLFLFNVNATNHNDQPSIAASAR